MKLNRIAAISLAAVFALLSGTSHAQVTPKSTTSTFNVKMELASRCFVNIDTAGPSSKTTTDVTLTYDAFQAVDEKASTEFNVRCTTDLPYTVKVADDFGTLHGIKYYIKLAAGNTPQYPATEAGDAEITSGLKGIGTDQIYSIGVLAPKGQPGQCGAQTCNTEFKQHTITVAY